MESLSERSQTPNQSVYKSSEPHLLLYHEEIKSTAGSMGGTHLILQFQTDMAPLQNLRLVPSSRDMAYNVGRRT
jgi:hypothetical protein